MLRDKCEGAFGQRNLKNVACVVHKFFDSTF